MVARKFRPVTFDAVVGVPALTSPMLTEIKGGGHQGSDGSNAHSASGEEVQVVHH